MGNKTLIYQKKLEEHLSESYKHLFRLENAFLALQRHHTFPLDQKGFIKTLDNIELLAYSDQIIYRFSKLQDCMGAKLFKSVLLYQGENIAKPFLDILNQLEKMSIINVDEWFELQDLRNEIAHDYENNEEQAVNILNAIYRVKQELKVILYAVQTLINQAPFL